MHIHDLLHNEWLFRHAMILLWTSASLLPPHTCPCCSTACISSIKAMNCRNWDDLQHTIHKVNLVFHAFMRMITAMQQLTNDATCSALAYCPGHLTVIQLKNWQLKHYIFSTNLSHLQYHFQMWQTQHSFVTRPCSFFRSSCLFFILVEV